MTHWIVKIGAVAVILAAAAMVMATGSQKVRPGDENRIGLMPEVVVRAEMPRLVVDTVRVHANRSVAAVGAATQVN